MIFMIAFLVCKQSVAVEMDRRQFLAGVGAVIAQPKLPVNGPEELGYKMHLTRFLRSIPNWDFFAAGEMRSRSGTFYRIKFNVSEWHELLIQDILKVSEDVMRERHFGSAQLVEEVERIFYPSLDCSNFIPRTKVATEGEGALAITTPQTPTPLFMDRQFEPLGASFQEDFLCRLLEKSPDFVHEQILKLKNLRRIRPEYRFIGIDAEYDSKLLSLWQRMQPFKNAALMRRIEQVRSYVVEFPTVTTVSHGPSALQWQTKRFVVEHGADAHSHLEMIEEEMRGDRALRGSASVPQAVRNDIVATPVQTRLSAISNELTKLKNEAVQCADLLSQGEPVVALDSGKESAVSDLTLELSGSEDSGDELTAPPLSLSTESSASDTPESF